MSKSVEAVAGGEIVVLRPDQHRWVAAAELHEDRVAAVAEVVQVRPREGGRVGGAAGEEVALPGTRGQVVGVPLVAGRREVDDTGGRHRIDRLRHWIVLERRLVEVDDVVDDDVAAGCGQVEDVLREARLTGEGGRETEARTGCEVVDDLEHRRALVAAARLAGQDVDRRRQVAACLQRSQRIDTVGEHADLHPRAVDAERASCRRRIVGERRPRRR